MNQESCARHPLTSLQVLYTSRANYGKVAAAFCLCPNEAVITSPRAIASFWRKKVLNYTHPWRHIINLSVDFLAIVPNNKSVYVTSHAKTYTNGFPFLNGKPFTSRLSAVQKKISSVQTALVIRSEKVNIRSNGWAHPFKKSLDPFERLESSVQEKFASV